MRLLNRSVRLLNRKPPPRISQRDPRDTLTPLQEATVRMWWAYVVGGEVNWNWMMTPTEEWVEFMTKTPAELETLCADVRKNFQPRAA